MFILIGAAATFYLAVIGTAYLLKFILMLFGVKVVK